VTVVQRYYDARNRGDVAEAMSVIAPEATYNTGPCTPQCVGAADIQKREVENGIAGGNQYTVLTATLSGMRVTVRLEIRSNLGRRAGVERFINDVTAEVQDGKIVAYSGVLDVSDPQTATFQAFQRSQAAGQTTPAPVPAALPRTGELGLRPPLPLLVGGALLLAAGLLLHALSRRPDRRSSTPTDYL
jgi:ketosteroid isomerase-like protein